MKLLLTLSTFLFSFSVLIAEGTDYSFEKPAYGIQENNCHLTDYFKEDTQITFYGDSRLDYADEPVTGGKNLLWYINNGIDGSDSSNLPNFGIQNFGQSTWIADQLNSHLFTCLRNKNYKISNRFVVNIGGNDWIWWSPGILGNPWIAVVAAAVIENNLRGIIGKLKMNASRNQGKFEVLILGNYPVVSGSYQYKAGSSKDLLPLETILNVGTIINAGVGYMNEKYKEIAEQNQIHYLDTTAVMRDPINPNSADPQLMLPDLLHPNHAGFQKWGNAVGSYLATNGFKDSIQRNSFFKTQFSIQKTIEQFIQTAMLLGNPNSPFSPLGVALTAEANLQQTLINLTEAKKDLQDKERILQEAKAELNSRLKRLQELQDQIRDVEYKINLVTKRIEKVDADILEIQARIAITDDEIIQKQNELNLAISERQRLEREELAYAQQQARLRAETDVARIAAEKARQDAEEAEIQRQLAKKKAAEAEKESQRAQEARDAALLFCLLTGKCW
ncbi:MAG: GDSL-type esterase/lipase family protein [Leptospiraceae bacterium]|nr:hypothetical protein [Leptospiraceae bacterium]MCK6381338.1 GDSL-type esterase/lipase family protein [Leptospiraceae bacterium]